MRSRGFTLIELMVTVAIIGILAGIAYPAFTNYLMKARRSDAKTALMGLQHAQEKLRANCRFYAENLDVANSCDAPASAADVDINYPTVSNEGFYTIAITAADAVGFTATATARGKQQGDADCPVMTLTVSAANPNGAKTPVACW